MILGFKRYYADGAPTLFEQQILNGISMHINPAAFADCKIHSLREDPHDRWKQGNTIEMAYGVRTKDYWQFNKGIEELSHCRSIQKVVLLMEGKHTQTISVIVDKRKLLPHEVEALIRNDGLSRSQFIDWFFGAKHMVWSGKIIHWTDFKY